MRALGSWTSLPKVEAYLALKQIKFIREQHSKPFYAFELFVDSRF